MNSMGATAGPANIDNNAVAKEIDEEKLAKSEHSNEDQDMDMVGLFGDDY